MPPEPVAAVAAPAAAGGGSATEPDWTQPPFKCVSLGDVLEEMGVELDPVKYPDGYFSDALYHDDAQVPRTVDELVDELKYVRDPALEGADLELLRRVFTSTYTPGAYEFEKFPDLVKEDWGPLAGQRPTGFHTFRKGFLGSRSGYIPFPEGWKEADFLKKDGTTGLFTVANDWKDRVEFMLMMDEPEGEPATPDRYVRPPQAAYSRASPLGDRADRNRAADGDRRVTPKMLKTGVITHIFECKAPGFRKMSARAAEGALCHAAVRVTIDGTKATGGLRVDILEGCIHRATPFDRTMLPTQPGSRGHAPVPEAYGIRVKLMLDKDFKRQTAEVAVSGNIRNQPAYVFATLAAKIPPAERMAQNHFRTGDVTGNQIANVMMETRKVHSTQVSSLAKNYSQELLAVATVIYASPPDTIIRCDVMSPDDRSLVILTDMFRARQMYAYGTWEGGVTALKCRGVVMDYARDFCHRCVSSVTAFFCEPFADAYVSSSQDPTERQAGGFVDAVGSAAAPSGTRREGPRALCHGGHALASQRNHDGGGAHHHEGQGEGVGSWQQASHVDADGHRRVARLDGGHRRGVLHAAELQRHHRPA